MVEDPEHHPASIHIIRKSRCATYAHERLTSNAVALLLASTLFQTSAKQRGSVSTYLIPLLCLGADYRVAIPRSVVLNNSVPNRAPRAAADDAGTTTLLGIVVQQRIPLRKQVDTSQSYKYRDGCFYSAGERFPLATEPRPQSEEGCT